MRFMYTIITIYAYLSRVPLLHRGEQGYAILARALRHSHNPLSSTKEDFYFLRSKKLVFIYLVLFTCRASVRDSRNIHQDTLL